MRAGPALAFYPKEICHPGFVDLMQVADRAGAPFRAVAFVHAGYEVTGEPGAIGAVEPPRQLEHGAILHQAGDAPGGFINILRPAAGAGFFRPHVIAAHGTIDTTRGD